MAHISDGRKLAQSIKEDIKLEVKKLKESTGRVPSLRNIMVGDDPGSCAYAKSQQKVARSIGMQYDLVSVPGDITQKDLAQLIKDLNQDKTVNGIMIHKPIPDHLDYGYLANFVDTDKDLEGINVANIGKMVLAETNIIPCTPASVMAHLKSMGVSLRGKEVVIVGHSQIVGKPLSLLLLNELATVTVCHIATSEAGKLIEHVSRAEILIVAVGKAGIIKGEWIKEGAVVIDVGINQVGDKIVGDVEFNEAEKKASFITPVPGGVGPVTVVMLMRNALQAFKSQNINRNTDTI